MSHDLVRRFLQSGGEQRGRDGAGDVPNDEDPREMAGCGEILTLGEVAHLLKTAETSMLEQSPEASLPAMFKKTMDYVDHFKKGDGVATLKEMRRACSRYGLSQYEVAILCNLLPETVEQVQILLPEFKRPMVLDDMALQTLLDTLRSLARH